MPGTEKTMHEFKRGTLHSGKGGPTVTSRQQAIAIGLSQNRKKKRKKKSPLMKGLGY